MSTQQENLCVKCRAEQATERFNLCESCYDDLDEQPESHGSGLSRQSDDSYESTGMSPRDFA